ncbi:pro-MCH [Solea solea]|uniref:pro-MCH n=1 Tax=Solea solea TaxID=90069 RepID=UPI00272A0BF2|nr:pro-MCH [Solea solea]
MISTYSVLFALVLFSELSSHLVAEALPATKVEDAMEQESLTSLLGDEVLTEHAMVSPVYRQSFMMDNRDEDGNPNVIVFSDMRQKGHRIRGRLNPSFAQSFPQLTDRKLSHNPPEYTLKMDRRDTDLNMLRCMIGRVYRPCWASNENL